MKRFITIALGAAALVVAGAAPAFGQDDVAVQGELHHFSAPAGSCDAGVCTYTTHGYGTVNIMGMGAPFLSVSSALVWDFTTTPCSTMPTIEFTLVGATGSISLSGAATVCPGNNPENPREYFTGDAGITGGTGEFSGITGNVSSQGWIGPNGPVIHLSGTASY